MAAFIFVLGAVVGSFLNVVIYRLGSGRSFGGRSGCLSCGKILGPLELVPVVSFLFQKGKCRACKTTLSWQYPLVEFVTGVLFLLIYLKQLPLTYTVFMWGVVSLLLVIVVYDLRHTIIPDELSIGLGVAAFLSLFIEWTELSIQIPHFQEIIAGPVFALPLFLFWFVSGGRWMGLGDAKLMLGLGWLLGLEQGIAAFVLSFWIGAAVSLLIILFQRLSPDGISQLFGTARRFTIKSEIPFGPFLILGFLLSFIFNIYGIPLIF